MKLLETMLRLGAPRLSTGSVRAVGIDLGTTNSVVAEAVWDHGWPGAPQVRCLEIAQETDEGRYTDALVPSVVARRGRQTLVGEGARRLIGRAAELGLEPNRDLFFGSKNDLGLRRTYYRAPDGFRTAAEIGGHVLAFLQRAATAEGAAADRTVVTVPASFQQAQRLDTVAAAHCALMELVGGDLLDEPTAALLDFLARTDADVLPRNGAPANLVVVDFGGGTLDVVVVRLTVAPSGEGVDVAPLAVSRYHRLGGGDIDVAVVHQVLLPALLTQNNLAPLDLDPDDKKRRIEPALLGVAESLKIAMCQEIARQRKLGRSADEGRLVQQIRGEFPCLLRDGRTLRLLDPALTATQFEEVLRPFLHRDLLFPRASEYVTTCSVFAPLEDALYRASLAAKDVDLCLLVGGSSLIPQLRQAVGDYFSRARLLVHPDATAVQTAVARGAALHALMLAVTGRGLFRPIVGDVVALLAVEGPVELVPSGSALPYPPDGQWGECRRLTAPRSSDDDAVQLRVKLVDSSRVCIASACWDMPAPVRMDEPLLLKYRMDANQVLELNLRPADAPDGPAFRMTVENPLTNVLNPNVRQAEIDELEERLRTGDETPETRVVTVITLVKCYTELGHYERALALLRREAGVFTRCPDALLGLMGGLYLVLGDWPRAEGCFRDAVQAGVGASPCLNLAACAQRQGKYAEALSWTDEAVRRDRNAVTLAHRADAARHAGDASWSASLHESLRLFRVKAWLTDEELTCLRSLTQLAGDAEWERRVVAEQMERARRRAPEDGKGDLPHALSVGEGRP